MDGALPILQTAIRGVQIPIDTESLFKACLINYQLSANNGEPQSVKMEPNSVRLNKLPSKDGNFLIQSNWSDDKVHISIYQPNTSKSFKGELTSEEIEESAIELEIPQSVFRKEIVAALTTHQGLPAYNYELNIEEKKFVLNKKAAFTIKYLDINLKEDTKTTGKMLEAAIDFINEQKQHNLEMEELKEKVQESYKETCEAFEKCVNEKRNMEATLMKKFTLLINSKKEKIAELQEMLMEKHDSAEEASEAENNDLTTEPSTSAVAKARSKSENNNQKEDDNTDEDFLASTQVLSQIPTDAVILQKRKNSNTDDDDRTTKVKQKTVRYNDDSN